MIWVSRSSEWMIQAPTCELGYCILLWRRRQWQRESEIKYEVMTSHISQRSAHTSNQVSSLMLEKTKEPNSPLPTTSVSFSTTQKWRATQSNLRLRNRYDSSQPLRSSHLPRTLFRGMHDPKVFFCDTCSCWSPTSRLISLPHCSTRARQATRLQQHSLRISPSIGRIRSRYPIKVLKPWSPVVRKMASQSAWRSLRTLGTVYLLRSLYISRRRAWPFRLIRLNSCLQQTGWAG